MFSGSKVNIIGVTRLRFDVILIIFLLIYIGNPNYFDDSRKGLKHTLSLCYT